jgi:hypothetical protein
LALVLAAASATKGQSQIVNTLPVTCKGERISRIDIDASPPFHITGNNIWQRAGRFAAKQHVTTQESVIRRYLALQVGDKCTELRRAESERILRVQPFIADASVLTYPDGNGGIILSVSTVDEVSVLFAMGIGGGAPAIHSLLIGDDNLMGNAIHTDVSWQHRPAKNFLENDGREPERLFLLQAPQRSVGIDQARSLLQRHWGRCSHRSAPRSTRARWRVSLVRRRGPRDAAGDHRQ